MRTAFRDQLDDFAKDLIEMCDVVGAVMGEATSALVSPSLADAESALSQADELEELRRRCEQRATSLLLLESPVASDLRQVLSSIYIVNDLRRMGALGMHVANLARRRHPNIAFPETVKRDFEELAAEVLTMLDKTQKALKNPSTAVALELAEEDDRVDEANQRILAKVTAHDWPNSAREAVDSALLARYFERFADHCVAVSTRIIYLITGQRPTAQADHLANVDSDHELSRRFDRLRDPK